MQVDGRTVRFEPLTESFLSSVVALEKRINSAPWSDRAFRNELVNPNGIFRIALIDHRVVGYAGLWTVIDEAHVTTVAVADELRRKGLGKALVTEILSLAKAEGMECATLEVRAGNTAAIELYEKLGFQKVGIRKGYYPDNREDACVMWLHDLANWSR